MELNGVGPHAKPWPTGKRYDHQLLAGGDHRNVLDRYRYWTVDAIKAHLDTHRLPLEVAVENLDRDFNMGTIIRNANAFNVSKVHIIGRRQWNKRGAMVTDVYMHIQYHKNVEQFVAAMRQTGKQIVVVDIVNGASTIESISLKEQSVLVFGAEGPGVSDELLHEADAMVMIEQAGSTRSVNVGVASGIAMYVWRQQHR